MSGAIELRTNRLLLRRWRASDAAIFAALNADPRVVEHLPGPLSRVQSDALISSIEGHFRQHGFGLWALEIPGVAPFAGFVGLSVPHFVAHFTPCVEVGWRLALDQWGKGYATEAAKAVLSFAFDRINLNEIVSFTVPENVRSIRVMEKLGMSRNPTDDFDHPAVPVHSRLSRHVLYRIANPARPNSDLQQTPPSRSLGRRD